MVMKKYEVTLFILGVPFKEETAEKVLIMAETQDKAEEIAHNRYYHLGFGVLDSKLIK